MAYPEAILGLGLKPRPNVRFKLRNNTPCYFLFAFNPKTNSKSLRREYIIQSTLHNSDRFYPDFCIFRTELLSPISVLLKCNTEKVST